MKKVGIIVEYNPLHNGHLIHINEIKKQAHADIIIACMSGSFSSRGDLSIFDKFEKTKQALTAGIDLVVELPYVYTVERADIFAKNAVDVLKMLDVDEIWIGSEENNPELYAKAYKKFRNNQKLRDGKSMKATYLDELPFKSNDILGFFYYKRIMDKKYNIKLKTIKREISNFLDTIIHHEYIASANAIRENINMINDYTPKFVSDSKKKILPEDKLYKYVNYKILTSSTSELKDIFMVDEGFENKLKKEINASSYNEYFESLVSKRYTKARIKRMLDNILINLTKKEINIIQSKDIDFIRVLGYNDTGKKYLKSIKKDINILTNIKEGINLAYDIEIRITKLLDFVYNTKLFKKEQSKPIEYNE